MYSIVFIISEANDSCQWGMANNSITINGIENIEFTIAKFISALNILITIPLGLHIQIETNNIDRPRFM